MVAYGAETSVASAGDPTFTGPTVTGADTIGFVHIGHGAEGTVETVTWGGSGMTRVSPAASNGVHLFSIDDPDSAAEIIVADTTTATQNRYVASYVSEAGTVVQSKFDSSATGTEATATLDSNTVTAAALMMFAAYHGGDVEVETLDSWEVNGSTTGVTDQYEFNDGGSGQDILVGLGFDLDGATGSTDAMSVTPSGGDDDLDVMLIEISVVADPARYLGSRLASNKRALTPDPPLLLSDRKV